MHPTGFLVAVVFLCAAGVASAQIPLIRPLPGGGPITAPLLREGVLRARVVDADVPALRALQPLAATGSSTVTLDLFPDVQIGVVLEQRQDIADGAVTFVGSVVGQPDGRAQFAIVDGVLAADVVVPSARYEVRYRADGHHQVQEADGRFVCGTPHPPDAIAAARPTVTQPVLEGPPVVVDILLAYTPRAMTDAGGAAAIRAVVHVAIAALNDALARSLVPHRVRAVHVAPTAYTETGLYTGTDGDMARLTRPADGFMDELPSLRDSVQADLVAVVAGPASDAGGVGNLMGTFDPASGATTGYSINTWYSLSGTLAHEVGHNLSLHHDPETTPNPMTLLPYGVGYRIPGQFSTIMAYGCPAPQAVCPRIMNYSNPAVLHNGTPTGVANVHDEARALTQTMPVAASFRGCRVRLPQSVTTMRVGAAGGTVAIDVETDSECVWDVSSTLGEWVTPASVIPTRNSGTATFAIAPNVTAAARALWLTINGQSIYLEQSGCFAITAPGTLRVGPAGGQVVVDVTAVPGCAWTAQVMAGTGVVGAVSPASGSGPGQVTVTVLPAPAATHIANFDVVTLRSGDDFRSVQVLRDGNGCSGAIAVSPADFTMPAAGGTRTIAVTAPPTCSWFLNQSRTGVTVLGPNGGTGNGTVTLVIPPNDRAQILNGTFGFLGSAAYMTQEPCEPTLTLPGEVPAEGGVVELSATAPATCTWVPVLTSTALRYELGGSASGNATFRLGVAANLAAGARQLPFSVNGRSYALTQRGRAPMLRRYLAEGATGSFFSTRLAIVNPGDTAVDGHLRFQRADGSVRTRAVTVPAMRRLTITPESVADLASADFATVLEASGPLVLDRTMTWDRSGFGSHAEGSLAEPSRTWYLAEGSTAGDFSLFYLMQNPNAMGTIATVTFLLPGGGAPLVRTYELAPNSRRTVSVDGLGAPLDATDVSAIVSATEPIIVERAMYATRAGQAFAAGHNSAGVTAPSLQWFLAEGATGSFFDLFVLIANPNPDDAQLTAEYLLPDGRVLTKSYVVRGNSRHTIFVDDEQIPANSGLRPLADVSVSTTIRSTNGVPVIVERAMWWPGPQLGPAYWTEAHNSPGATVTGTRWALAEGEAGGPNDAETYILIANTSEFEGRVRVQLLFDDGTSAERTLAVPAKSRATVGGNTFPGAANKRFGAIVESLGATPAQIVVERAMYTNANGAFWAAGTNALATRLAP